MIITFEHYEPNQKWTKEYKAFNLIKNLIEKDNQFVSIGKVYEILTKHHLTDISKEWIRVIMWKMRNAGIILNSIKRKAKGKIIFAKARFNQLLEIYNSQHQQDLQIDDYELERQKNHRQELKYFLQWKNKLREQKPNDEVNEELPFEYKVANE